MRQYFRKVYVENQALKKEDGTLLVTTFPASENAGCVSLLWAEQTKGEGRRRGVEIDRNTGKLNCL